MQRYAGVGYFILGFHQIPLGEYTYNLICNSGVPQGSFLGPLLFNINFNDLFYFIKEAKLSNYADDDQLYFADTDPAIVEHVLNRELVVVCEWFRNNKMILNTEKCKALVLSRKPDVVRWLSAKFWRDLYRADKSTKFCMVVA